MACQRSGYFYRPQIGLHLGPFGHCRCLTRSPWQQFGQHNISYKQVSSRFHQGSGFHSSKSGQCLDAKAFGELSKQLGYPLGPVTSNIFFLRISVKQQTTWVYVRARRQAKDESAHRPLAKRVSPDVWLLADILEVKD